MCQVSRTFHFDFIRSVMVWWQLVNTRISSFENWKKARKIHRKRTVRISSFFYKNKICVNNLFFTTSRQSFCQASKESFFLRGSISFFFLLCFVCLLLDKRERLPSHIAFTKKSSVPCVTHNFTWLLFFGSFFFCSSKRKRQMEKWLKYFIWYQNNCSFS